MGIIKLLYHMIDFKTTFKYLIQELCFCPPSAYVRIQFVKFQMQFMWKTVVNPLLWSQNEV